MPAELAVGLALKELRYKAGFALDSPQGMMLPNWFLRPVAYGAAGSAVMHSGEYRESTGGI